ncbi:MAG TPA: HNH endonuclease [Verrucomicrobiae bacterium]|nr:HNH endonuclease [Verrucomicrobiae bacterium]
MRHHVEHIIAKQHGGSGDAENLALACHRCNLQKGPNLTGIDPQTAEVARLFTLGRIAGPTISPSKARA